MNKDMLEFVKEECVAISDQREYEQMYLYV